MGGEYHIPLIKKSIQMSIHQKELLNDYSKILLEIEELPLSIYKGTFAILNLRYDLINYLETHPNSVR